MVAVRIALLLFATNVTAQCICPRQSLKWDYKEAAAVFIATSERGPEADFHLRVERAWKGTFKPGDVVPFDPPMIDHCDFGFRAGPKYLVVVTEVFPGAYRVVECSHTGIVDDESVRQDIAMIDRRYRWWNSRLSSIRLRRR